MFVLLVVWLPIFPPELAVVVDPPTPVVVPVAIVVDPLVLAVVPVTAVVDPPTPVVVPVALVVDPTTTVVVVVVLFATFGMLNGQKRGLVIAGDWGPKRVRQFNFIHRVIDQ